MKNLSRTFLLIGAILSILSFFGFIIGGATCMYVAGHISDEVLKEAFKNIWNQLVGDNDAQKLECLRLILKTLGGLMIFWSLITIPAAICSFAARNKPTTGMLVAVIVLGVLSGTSVFVILGGIFGLIGNNQERNRQRLAEQQE